MPSMEYATFFARFGGAARTKNVADPARPRRVGKRPFVVPAESELPPHFIRLCPWEMEYLFSVARRARRGILEIGRFNGGSTFLFACASPDVPIHSIDINPQDDDRLRRFFKRHGVGENVHLIIGDSRSDQPVAETFDVLFIDGDHTYEGCSADIETWYPRLTDNGHLIFHDSYLGNHGVQDAIIDFIERRPELEIVSSPYIGASYWHYPAGSIAHLRKRPRQASIADQG